MRAYEGIARPMLATLIAAVAPRPVCPIQRPTGKPIRIATRTEAPAISEVLQEADGDPIGPAPVRRVEEPADDVRHQRAPRARAHGVRRRSSCTSSTSATMAKATERPAPR